MEIPLRFTPSARESAALRACRRFRDRWTLPLVSLAAAPLILVGGWASAAWLWTAIHPALGCIVMALALVAAAFALAAGVALIKDDWR